MIVAQRDGEKFKAYEYLYIEVVIGLQAEDIGSKSNKQRFKNVF